MVPGMFSARSTPRQAPIAKSWLEEVEDPRKKQGTAGRERLVVRGRRVARSDARYSGKGTLVLPLVGGGGGLSRLKEERRTREEARRLFEAADLDRNATLDKTEVRTALRDRGLELPDADFGKLYRQLDTNGDGRIDFVEFERALVGLDDGGGQWKLEEPMRLRLTEAFAAMDGNKDGVLEEEERGDMRGELSRLLMELGMSPKALDHVKGGLNLEAFRRQVEREREITLKEQGLSAAELGRAVAGCIPRGCAEHPLDGLETMGEEELKKLCVASVLPAVQRALLQLQEALREQTARRKEAGKRAAAEGNSKFAVGQKGGVKMAMFGSLEDFHKGIAEKIGLPNPKLMAGMESEHCKRGDSRKWFSPGNYDTTTTPEAEWWVVNDHRKGEAVSHGPRRVRSTFDIMRDDIVVQAKLREEEVLALQLYTGPMFFKYNAVLRGFPDSTVKEMGGNQYTTTIYCVVSGIIKLSKVMKLPEDRKVYRGLGGLGLPEEFLRADEFGVRGGVEFAMMSTSVDRNVALQYAGSEVPCLFEIDVGACDRGASLEFLSQYPSEEEILLPPRSYLEVVEGVQRLEAGPDGNMVRVVKLKVNANMMSSTIEEIEGRRRRLFLSAGENTLLEIKSMLAEALLSKRVEDELRHRPADEGLHVQVRDSILAEAEEWLGAYRLKKSEWFNEEGQYAAAQRELTELEKMAMRKFECWVDRSSGLRAEDLGKEKMLLVSRRAESEQTRKLNEARAGGGGEGGGARELALELCKRRGLVIKGEVDDASVGVKMEPALVASAANGDMWGLRLLLEAGCSVGSEAEDGSTALHRASMMGHLDCVQELVRAKAEVGAKDRDGRTCLYMASEMGHKHVIDYLVGIGGRDLCMAETNHRQTCAHAAAQIGHVPSLESLFKGGGVEILMSQDKDGRSTALNAAFDGHLDALKFLVAKCGPKVLKMRKVDGTPCTYFAAQNDHLQCLKLILEKGSKDLLLQVDDERRSCAYAAVKNGQLDMLKRIVQLGGRDLLKIVTKEGESCALLAAKKGDAELLKCIVQQGGKELLRFVSGEGVSCAFLASEQGNLPMLRLIVDQGGKELLGDLDNDGHSCAFMASTHGHLACVRYIAESGGRKLLGVADNFDQSCALTACLHGHLEVLRYIVEQLGKEALARVDRDGTSCAIWASLTGRTDMLRYIVEQGGAELLMAVKNDGKSCAYAASQKGHLGTLRYLAEAGGHALMALKSKDGLSCAAVAKQQGHGAVAGYLEREWSMAVEQGWSSRRRGTVAAQTYASVGSRTTKG